MTDWRNIFKIAINENTISTDTPVTQEMVQNGQLAKGDYVYPSIQLWDPSGAMSLKQDQTYKVIGLPLNPNFPGAFVIDIGGGKTWGFHFGKGGAGQYFVKKSTSPEAEFFIEEGDIPYHILNIIQRKITVGLKELIKLVMTQTMNVPPSQIIKVTKQVKYSIQSLNYYGYIGEIEPDVYGLTPKGKELLNAK